MTKMQKWLIMAQKKTKIRENSYKLYFSWTVNIDNFGQVLSRMGSSTNVFQCRPSKLCGDIRHVSSII